jgi:hypothetical protein
MRKVRKKEGERTYSYSYSNHVKNPISVPNATLNGVCVCVSVPSFALFPSPFIDFAFDFVFSSFLGLVFEFEFVSEEVEDALEGGDTEEGGENTEEEGDEEEGADSTPQSYIYVDDLNISSML